MPGTGSPPVAIVGGARFELYDAQGVLKASAEVPNVVTQVGEQMYAERGAGVASPPAAPTGMKLGTGSTATAKTSTGSALTTYLTNSHQAFDATFPSSSLLAAVSLSTVTATASTDTFTKTAHGLVNGRWVVFSTAPSGLTAGVIYYVIAAAANTFQVSATPGGTAADITADSSTVALTSAATRRITYQATFAAGKATSAAAAITEGVIVNDTLADATSTSANTVARLLWSPAVPSKQSTDSLVVSWWHDLQSS